MEFDRQRRQFIRAAGGVALCGLGACSRPPPGPAHAIGLLDMRGEAGSRIFQGQLLQHVASQLGIPPAGIGLTSRWGPHGSRLDADAADLLRESPALIVAISRRGVGAVRKQNAEVPVVFSVFEDPVQSGLIESFREPGNHLTGVWNGQELNCKRIELLVRSFPTISHIAVLHDGRPERKAGIETALQSCVLPGVKVSLVWITSRDDLRRLASMLPARVDALCIPHSGFCSTWPDDLIMAVERLRVPALFDGLFLVERGAVASLEPIELDEPEVLGRLAASVLLGTPIETIPVERPKTTRLSINLGSARRQNIRFPDWFIRAADRIVG